MDTIKHSARFYLPSSKIVGTFIEQELNKTGENCDNEKNYIKIELKAKKNKIFLETIVNCFEYLLNKNFDFHFNKDNLISYFYAFSLCHLQDKKKEVLERLLLDLTDENLIYFIKVVSTLEDDFLHSYSFWLLRYLINKNDKFDLIKFNGYDYSSIVKTNSGVNFSFNDYSVICKKLNYNNYTENLFSANLNFLKNYYDTIYRPEVEKYLKVNNYFNMGKVLRRKSNDNLVDDYPHYYQLLLENDPSLLLYAIRHSENGSFILTKSIVRHKIIYFILG